MKRERGKYEDFELHDRIHAPGVVLRAASQHGRQCNLAAAQGLTYVAPPYIHIGGLKPVIRRRLTKMQS